MQEFKYIILGGGITGLITSIELSKKHPGEVLLIEKENEVGGQLRTIRRNGFRYDIGSHIIHDEVGKDVLDFINQSSGGLLRRNVRIGKLIFRKAYIIYPLKSIKFMTGLGFVESIRCSISLLWNRFLKLFSLLDINHNSNYENDLKRNVGTRAYNIFYRPYALKVWNCDPKLISNTAIKRQMAMVGPWTFLMELINYTIKKQHDKYYYYLDGGIGKLPEGLEKIAKDCGVKIRLSIDNYKIEGNKIIIKNESGNEETIHFEKLISTISLGGILSMLDFGSNERELFKKLEFRGLKLIFVHIEGDVQVEGECFYMPESKYKLGRVSVPKRFSSSMNPDSKVTGIICEIPCTPGDEIWNMTTSEAVEVCHRDLKEAGLLNGREYIQSESDFQFNIKDIYPMYYKNWKEHLKDVLEIAGDKYPNIYISGKSGFFMQSNMDRSIEMGKMLPKELEKNISPNGWYKNIDYFHNLLLRD